MDVTFNRVHLVGTYGAFGTITRRRYELVIEGTDDPDPAPGSIWQAFEFPAEPTDPRRRPPQEVADHLRLDWLLWLRDHVGVVTGVVTGAVTLRSF
jgi:hypothetical protein